METMTRDQVAELFGVHVRVVTRYAARGDLTKYVSHPFTDGAILFSADQVRELDAYRRRRSGEDAVKAVPPVAVPRQARW
jgi:hypothetical protein